jgi:hypothetical protein
MKNKCACSKKGKKYKIVACKGCKKFLEESGFKLEED